MKLLFIHGWGFDAHFWSGDFLTSLAAHLPAWPAVRIDRGYFHAPSSTMPDGPFVAITHSLGTMHLLRAAPSECRGLVAINGFDCFAARPDFSGISPRIVTRMMTQLARTPDQVVSDFRLKCGTDAPFPELDPDRLHDDLALLRDGDYRAMNAQSHLPILSLQGAQDPILPGDMRDRLFAHSPCCEQVTHPDGGHLLPLTHPAYCAAHIGSWLERIA